MKKFARIERTHVSIIERLEIRQLLSAAPGVNPSVFLDTSFGSQGVVTGYGGPVEVLSNGKIMVDTNGQIRRLNANGSLDTTFNPAGAVDDWAPTRARQSDGKLLDLTNGVLTRYNTNGTLDKTFGVGGHFSAFIGKAGYSAFNPTAIAMQGNSIVVAGDTRQNSPGSSNGGEFAVERVNPNGTIDAAFGLNTAIGNQVYTAHSSRVRVASNGTIYIAGSLPLDPNGYFVRFNANGSRGFSIRLRLGDDANDFAFGPGGTILIAGGLDSYSDNAGDPIGGHEVASVLRLNSDLTGDSTFGGVYGVQVDYSTVSSTSFADAIAITVGPDGKIVEAVSTQSGLQLIRLLPNGPLPAGNSISGYVFDDFNENGKIDPAETQGQLAGQQVYIDTHNTGVYQSGDPIATTDANGYYTLSGLAAGTYRVREIRPDGYIRTLPAGPWPTYGVYTVTFTSAHQAVSGKNFGNAAPNSISGTVLNDPLGNGADDRQRAGLGNWTVYIDANNNGKLDSGETMTRTSGNGNFSFTGLPVGDYVVRVTSPTGWRQTFPTAGFGQQVEMPVAGDSRQGMYFLESQSAGTQASIGGVVALDYDWNNMLDPADVTIDSALVYVDANNNGKFDPGEISTRTDAYGNYALADLPAGTYNIRVTDLNGATQTSPSNGGALHVVLGVRQAKGGVNFLAR